MTITHTTTHRISGNLGTTKKLCTNTHSNNLHCISVTLYILVPPSGNHQNRCNDSLLVSHTTYIADLPKNIDTPACNFICKLTSSFASLFGGPLYFPTTLSHFEIDLCRFN